MSAYLKVLECFGFRGRGGFRVQTLINMTREQVLYELYSSSEYQKQYKNWGHHWADKAPIPQEVKPGFHTFGYELLDDPWEHGGTGEGQYYYHPY